MARVDDLIGDIQAQEKSQPQKQPIDDLISQINARENRGKSVSRGQRAIDFLEDIVRVPESLVVGGAMPIARSISKPFTSQEFQERLKRVPQLVEPQSWLGKGVVEGVSYPFSKGLEWFNQGLKKAGVPEELAGELTEGTAAGVSLGGAIRGGIPKLSTPESLAKDLWLKQYAGPITAIKEAQKKNDQMIKNDWAKAMRPSIKSVGNKLASRDKYYNQGVIPTVEDIINNKDKYELTGADKYGAFILPEGSLPESRLNLLEAKEPLMEATFQGYKAELRAAGETGVRVDVAPFLKKITNEIKRISDLDVPGTEPLLGYLNEYHAKINDIMTYRGGKLSLEKAEETLKFINTKIKNKEYKDFSQMYVDTKYATFLRNALYDVTQEVRGPRFEKLRKQYAAYRIVEDDIARGANAAANMPVKSIFDISDVWVGYHASYAALTGNIASLGAAAGAGIIKKRMRYLTDPDTRIKFMFRDAEKNMNKIKRMQSILDKSNPPPPTARDITPPPGPPTAPTPAAPSAKAIVSRRYDKMFDALKRGDTSMAGVSEPVLVKARAAYDAGLIKSGNDLMQYARQGFPDIVKKEVQVNKKGLEARRKFERRGREEDLEGL